MELLKPQLHSIETWSQWPPRAAGDAEAAEGIKSGKGICPGGREEEGTLQMPSS